MDSLRRFTPERFSVNQGRDTSPRRFGGSAMDHIPTVSTPSMPTPLAGHRGLASPGRLATSTLEIAASIRRGDPPPSDLYLQKITDDLINEKRCRRAEREEFDLQIKRLEDRIMTMDDASLRADTEVEKSVHLKQKVRQLADQSELRKHEIARLQDELVSVTSARDRDRELAAEHQQQQNLKIEAITKELSETQGKCHQLTHSHVTKMIMNDVQTEEELEQVMPLVFGITAVDIPSVDIVRDIEQLKNDPQWQQENTNNSTTLTGTTKIVVADGLAASVGLCAGDVVLRVEGIEVASVVHLQVMLLSFTRPESSVQVRRGSVIKTVTLKLPEPAQLSYPDVQRLCQLAGGMSTLLADYKEHLNTKSLTLDTERQRRLQLETDLEKERQVVVDTQRLLSAAQEKEATIQDRTMDVQLVGVNARLTQEKKILTLRLSRAQEDKQKLETELKKAKEIADSLQSQRMQQWERSIDFDGEKVPPPREPTPPPPPTPTPTVSFNFDAALSSFASVGAPEQQVIIQCLAQHATKLASLQAKMTNALWKVGSLRTDRQRLLSENVVLKGTLDDLLQKIDSSKTLEMGMKQKIFELETSLKLVSTRNPPQGTNKNLSPSRRPYGLPPPPPVESYSPSTVGFSRADEDVQEVEVIAHHTSPRICVTLRPMPHPVAAPSFPPGSPRVAHMTPALPPVRSLPDPRNDS